MWATVYALAGQLADQLRPACARIEIAGSLRRQSENPRDIELVAISHPEDTSEVVRDMFGDVVATIQTTPLEDAVFELTDWELDRVIRRNGPRYKRLRSTQSRNYVGDYVACDLFIVRPPATWGVIYTIRTGPADFSQALVTRALQMGLKVDGGQLWKLHRDGRREALLTPEESDFFAILGLPWLEPQARTIEMLTRVAAGRHAGADKGGLR